MLWMKAWLETRWRLVYGMAIPLISLSFPYIGGGTRSAGNAQAAIGVMTFFTIFNAVYLAGAGIRTQQVLAGGKTPPGSMYYTLSLPVSRLWLLSVRAGVGFFEFACASAVIYCSAWIVSPLAHGNWTFVDRFKFVLASIACTACL
jgi:hypothetical protein